MICSLSYHETSEKTRSTYVPGLLTCCHATSLGIPAYLKVADFFSDTGLVHPCSKEEEYGHDMYMYADDEDEDEEDTFKNCHFYISCLPLML